MSKVKVEVVDIKVLQGDDRATDLRAGEDGTSCPALWFVEVEG